MGFLSVVIDSKVATVTINHPPVNVLSGEVLKELEATMDELGANRDVKVIVLTGTGPVFIAGADIKAMAQIKTNADGKKAAGREIEEELEAEQRPAGLGSPERQGGDHEFQGEEQERSSRVLRGRYALKSLSILHL